MKNQCNTCLSILIIGTPQYARVEVKNEGQALKEKEPILSHGSLLQKEKQFISL